MGHIGMGIAGALAGLGGSISEAQQLNEKRKQDAARLKLEQDREKAAEAEAAARTEEIRKRTEAQDRPQLIGPDKNGRFVLYDSKTSKVTPVDTGIDGSNEKRKSLAEAKIKMLSDDATRDGLQNIIDLAFTSKDEAQIAEAEKYVDLITRSNVTHTVNKPADTSEDLIKAAATGWAEQGVAPSKKDQARVLAYMQQNGMQPPKSAPKTAEDKLARVLFDSGEAKSEKEATVKAATMIAQSEKAKVALTQGVMITPQDMEPIVKLYLATGQQPSFGLGANNPNRALFWRMVGAELRGEGGVEAALKTRVGFGATKGSINDLTKIKGRASNLDNRTSALLDQVEQLSARTGRTGSSLVNDLYLDKLGKLTTSEQTEAFRQLKIAVNGAARDYASLISSASGGSITTDRAREQADALINEGLSEGNLKAAVAQMRRDIKIAQDGIDQALQQQYTDLGGVGGPATPPPPGSAPADRPPAPGGGVVNVKRDPKTGKLVMAQ